MNDVELFAIPPPIRIVSSPKLPIAPKMDAKLVSINEFMEISNTPDIAPLPMIDEPPPMSISMDCPGSMAIDEISKRPD